MATPTPPTTPPKVAKLTLQQRNEQNKEPSEYDVGAVPAQIISSGMRMAFTSKEYLETVDFGSMDGLRECINALELLQMRRKAWLSGDCVDIPLVWAYKSQPRAVRHRINLLLNNDTHKLFEDPVVPGRENTDTSPFDIKDEQRADARFLKTLDTVYRNQPKLWKRIRTREFTVWSTHTSSHFVTIILRMRRSDPYADQSTRYDEVCQFAILEPTLNPQILKRVHRRVRGILSRDGIKIAPDAYRTPWHPTQSDDYSCGLRAYSMAKEFMERLTLIYTAMPVVFHATNMPVTLSNSTRQDLAAPLVSLGGQSVSSEGSKQGSAMDMDEDLNPILGAMDPNRRINEPKFQRVLWEYPFHGYVNENAVREQMIGAVVCVALNRYDYQARAALVPIDSVTDRDLMYDQALRKQLLKNPDLNKNEVTIPTDAADAKVYPPDDLRPQRTGKVQRFKSGAQSFNPVQNPKSAPLDDDDTNAALNAFANITISETTGASPLKHGNFAGPQEAQQADAGKQQLTASQWQRRNKGIWKQGRLRKAKRHDRYGPAFLKVPAFRKALWENANKQM
ncbi:hypothetical protein PG984_008855 [Apiospora sp. TS-2023a]